MANYVQTSAFRYVGATGDVKPTATTTPVGTQCIDYTTGKVYENDGTTWQEVTPAAAHT